MIARVKASRVSHVPGIYLITAICGLIDATSFVGLGGTFVELMTGNLILVALQIGDPNLIVELPGMVVPLSNFVSPIGAFIVGAGFGGWVIRGSKVLSERRRGFIVEWCVLVAAVVLTLALDPGASGVARNIVIAFLAFAMGLQNALMLVHGVPNLATNVMTLTMTSLFSNLADGSGRWHRQVASISIFVGSVIVGAALVQRGIVYPLLLAVAIFTAALYWLIPTRAQIAERIRERESEAG